MWPRVDHGSNRANGGQAGKLAPPYADPSAAPPGLGAVAA